MQINAKKSGILPIINKGPLIKLGTVSEIPVVTIYKYLGVLIS